MLVGCDSTNKQSIGDLKENVIVVVLKFKAKPEKGDETVVELTKLLEKVKQEPYFISIKLHIDPEDNTNILLYEEWEDESYYKSEHMKTDHLQEFIANSEDFLSGPPEITFWKAERKF